MLSDKCVKILLLIKSDKIEEIKDFDSLSYLEKNGLVSTAGNQQIYVTPFGEEQLDNYYFHKDNLEVQKSNLNETIKASKQSKNANIIAICALIFSVLINIPAIINLIKSLIK